MIPSDFAAHLAEYVDEVGSRVLASNGPLDARELKRLRTALRRLRALVRETAADDAVPNETDYDRIVRRAGKRLGDVRDLDVAIVGIAARRAVSDSDLERAALDELEARLARDRESALGRATKRLGGLDEIVVGAHRHVAGLASDERCEELARKWWATTRAGLGAALDHRGPTDEDLDGLHEIRIAARRARYGVELFGSIAPVEAIEWQGDALTLQRTIGRHRDAALLHARLRAEVERATTRRRITLARGLEASVIGARAERTRTFFAARDAIAKARARPLEGPPQLRGNPAASSPTRNPPGRSGLA